MKKNQRFDTFSALPHEAVISGLSKLGLDLITRLFAEEEGPAFVGPSEIYSAFGSKGVVRLILKAPRPGTSRLPAMLFHQRELLRLKLMKRKRLSSTTWHRWKQRDALGSLTAAGWGRIPPEVWWMYGEAAWRDPRFLREATRLITDFIRTRAVLLEGVVPQAAPHPNTMWMLLALCAPVRTGLPHSPWTTKARINRVFHKVAVGRVHEEQWARFWDQWLLARAVRNRARVTFRVDPVLKDSLFALPVWQYVDRPDPRKIPVRFPKLHHFRLDLKDGFEHFSRRLRRLFRLPDYPAKTWSVAGKDALPPVDLNILFPSRLESRPESPDQAINQAWQTPSPF